MFSPYIFNESSPNAPGVSVSTQPVFQSALPAGIAGPLDDSDCIVFTCDLVGATGGTLDIYVQTSPDGGGSWYDQVHLPQIAAGAPVSRAVASVSLFTNSPTTNVVGKGLAPALAANTIINGPYSDRCRLVFVAGSGTTAGAVIRVIAMIQRSHPRN